MATNPNATPDDINQSFRDALSPGISVLKDRLGITADYNRRRREAELNWKQPEPVFLPGKKSVGYLTAPKRLKRMFGSPMLMSGVHATGPNHERELTGGWGDDRTSNGVKRIHAGIDYPAPYGEKVLSCASGTVGFVGYERPFPQSGQSLAWAHQDKNRNVLDANNVIVATHAKGEIGFGGITVWVKHDGDFAGYTTAYCHLSKVLVETGKRIDEGDPVGEIGMTGSTSGGHLHFTLRFGAAYVNPARLVPNYWKGRPDSTTTDEDILLANYIDPGPSGRGIVVALASSMLLMFDRSTKIERLSREAIADGQANHSAYVQQGVDQQQNQLLESIAKFQKTGIVVVNPMSFDFDTGYWVDGTGKNRAV